MARTRRFQLSVCIVTCATLLLVGCNTSTCDRAADSLTVSNAEGVRGDNTWLSAPYHVPDPNVPLQGAPYQHFYPARTISFEHDLGSLPVAQIWLAFSDYGSLAPGSGNEDIVECMDDQVIQIKNDTCSDFYVWVSAEGSGVHASTPCPREDLGIGAAGAEP